LRLVIGGRRIFFVNNPQCPELSKYSRYELVTNGGQLLGGGLCFFPLARSFTALLKHHITNLENETFKVSIGGINLFPRKNIPTAITQNVKISASPIFIPERSSPDREYLWAYSINMSMDQLVPKNFYDSQLVSRHWDITSNGRTEVVNGPGVIGEHPKMFPGANFTYESCCPLKVPSGTMGGSFQMRSLSDKGMYDAVVPTFTFSVPEMIEEDEDDEDNMDVK